MPLDEALVAKFALFERCTDAQATSELYQIINEAANGKSEVLKKLEKMLDDIERFKEVCPEYWKKHLEFLSDWMTLEPYLADIDLRPVLYLSRETMPLRYSRAGLSAIGTQTLITLMRAPSRVSTAAKLAVKGLEPTEPAPIMEALISELRKESNWNRKPDGFDGALVLADNWPEAGKLLSAFINSLSTKLPPWLKVIVKDAEWYTEDKEK
jgi:predicted KAP-like P-loop ATPase